jgi:hypothetical protein
MENQHPELNELMSHKVTPVSKMLNDNDEEFCNLEVLDPVLIKFEGSSAKGMKGTIIIKKLAIKDKKFL